MLHVDWRLPLVGLACIAPEHVRPVSELKTAVQLAACQYSQDLTFQLEKAHEHSHAAPLTPLLRPTSLLWPFSGLIHVFLAVAAAFVIQHAEEVIQAGFPL